MDSTFFADGIEFPLSYIRSHLQSPPSAGVVVKSWGRFCTYGGPALKSNHSGYRSSPSHKSNHHFRFRILTSTISATPLHNAKKDIPTLFSHAFSECGKVMHPSPMAFIGSPNHCRLVSTNHKNHRNENVSIKRKIPPPNSWTHGPVGHISS